jgi:drug/metabolite transporter (DMT)-like permease
VTSVALALLAGFLFAYAAGLQQQAGRASLVAPAVHTHGRLQVWLPITAALHGLLRHPLFVLGWVVNLGGFITQAVALHVGSVALVQPVLVTQLLFTIPIAAVHTRRRPTPTDFAAGAAVCLGVGMFVASWGTRDNAVLADRPRVLAAVIAALCLALVLVALASRMRSSIRAVFASVAAGLCFAVSAVLMKLTLDSLLNAGVGATAHDWCGYLLAVSTCLGLIIGQDALAAGALSTAVAGMAITNPVASAVIGVLAFDESAPTSVGSLAGLSIAGLLLVVGVIGLAQSATIRADARDAEAHKVTRRQGSATSWAHGLTQ